MLPGMMMRLLAAHKPAVLAIVVLQLLQTTANLLLPTLNAAIIDDGIVAGNTGIILRLGGWMAGIAAVQVAAALAAGYFSANVAMKLGRQLRQELFVKVQALSSQEVGTFGVPSLVTRATNDVQQIQALAVLVFTMLVAAPAMGIGGIVLALNQDVVLSGIVVAIVPVLVLIMYLIVRRLVPLYREGQILIDRIGRVLREQIIGANVIRAFVRQAHEARRFAVVNRELTRNNLQSALLVAGMLPLIMIVVNLSSVAVVWFGGHRIQSGDMRLGALTAFIAYILQILIAIMMAMYVMMTIRPGLRGAAHRRPQGAPSRPHAWPPPTTTCPPTASMRAAQILDELSRVQVETLERNCEEFGVPVYSLGSDHQGIVHVIGPEMGVTQPGMTIVCGDSHTSTHGAFGALAFGIGTSEVEHVLATQTLQQRKPKSMRILYSGELGYGVTAKDLMLSTIGRIGVSGGAGYAIEYAGPPIEALSMEGRMTMCNMTIEAGGRAGMVAPDDTTLRVGRGPAGRARRRLPARGLAGAAHRRRRGVRHRGRDRRLGSLAPGHLGHHPRRWSPRSPSRCPSPREARATTGAGVHGAGSRHPDAGDRARSRVHRVLHQLAHRRPARGRRGDPGPPGGRQRHRDGGAGLRPGEGPGRGGGPRRGVPRGGLRLALAGCSMCLGMNPDIAAPGERVRRPPTATSRGARAAAARSHLVSPKMAAAAAIEGHFVDIREWCMNQSEKVEGRSRCCGAADVDTDQIIPKQFLKRVERSGFGEYLFYDWAKEPGWDLDPNPILVTGRNFGCGSSREHAPWALEDFGFKVLVAPSFADIFYSNCTKIGLLPVPLPEEEVEALMEATEAEVHLADQVVRFDGREVPFDIHPETKRRLLEGLDDIGVTLQDEHAIERVRGQARAPGPGHHLAGLMRDWDARAYERVSSPQARVGRAGARSPAAGGRRDRAGRRLRHRPGDQDAAGASARGPRGGGRLGALDGRAGPRERWTRPRHRDPGRPGRARARRARGRRLLQRRVPLGARPRGAVRPAVRRAASPAGALVAQCGGEGNVDRFLRARGCGGRARALRPLPGRLGGAVELRLAGGDRGAPGRGGVRRRGHDASSPGP